MMIQSANHADSATSALRFLLSPEDSTATRPAASTVRPGGWHLAKTVLWITCAVMVSLMVGQL